MLLNQKDREIEFVMSEKIVGYLLLTIGVFVILFSALGVYTAFIKKSVPLKFFDLPGVTIQANKQMGIPEMEIVPKGSVNETANLVAYLALMGFLVGAGYKLAMVGVGLLRPVVIKQRDPQ